MASAALLCLTTSSTAMRVGRDPYIPRMARRPMAAKMNTPSNPRIAALGWGVVRWTAVSVAAHSMTASVTVESSVHVVPS